MDINATKDAITDGIIKSVKDYKNSIKELDPAVKRYFDKNIGNFRTFFWSWSFIKDGEEIEIEYKEQYMNGHYDFDSVNVPIKDVVDIAIDLILNKKEE